MDHLLAKKKGRDGGIVKVVSNQRMFELPQDLDNSIEYSPAYILEEDEWFSIGDLSEKSYFIDFLDRRFISTDYNQIESDDYNNIDYLCSYQSGIYFFQRVSPSKIIRKKYLSLSNAPIVIEDQPIIVIENYPHAIYVKSEDILYFKKLTDMTSMFPGIEDIYKEATQEETQEFLANDFVTLINDYSADKVKKANRKRIGLVMHTLAQFTDVERQNIFLYIHEYCDNLVYDEVDQSFSISNEEDLKKLLYGIEQRYYTTTMGGERRLANSITTL